MFLTDTSARGRPAIRPQRARVHPPLRLDNTNTFSKTSNSTAVRTCTPPSPGHYQHFLEGFLVEAFRICYPTSTRTPFCNQESLTCCAAWNAESKAVPLRAMFSLAALCTSDIATGSVVLHDKRKMCKKGLEYAFAFFFITQSRSTHAHKRVRP